MSDEPMMPEQARRLLLMSVAPGEVVVSAADDTPPWLVEECIAAGLVERVGSTSAWRLTATGRAARDALLAD